MNKIKILLANLLMWTVAILYVPFYGIVVGLTYAIILPLAAIADEIVFFLKRKYERHPMWYDDRIKNIISLRM